MSRMIVFAVYAIIGMVGCVMSVQLLVRIAICLTPWVESCHNTCCFIYQIEKERMRRRKVIHPILIINIPTAEVSYEATNVYPASIVSTAAVEIV